MARDIKASVNKETKRLVYPVKNLDTTPIVKPVCEGQNSVPNPTEREEDTAQMTQANNPFLFPKITKTKLLVGIFLVVVIAGLYDSLLQGLAISVALGSFSIAFLAAIAGAKGVFLLWKKRRKNAATVLAVVTLTFCFYQTINAFACLPTYNNQIDKALAALPSATHTLYYARKDKSTAPFLSNAERSISKEEIQESALFNAIISIEDQRYYSRIEGPIDAVATLRAAGKTLIFGKKQGGSTIQLQIAKLILEKIGLGTLRSKFFDKPNQSLLALRLCQLFEPEELLALYCNLVQIYGNKVGMAAAAYNLFGIDDLRNLSVEQAALLAAMLRSPANYNPRTNPDAALERRNLVINKMFEQGYISKTQCEEAKGKEIKLVMPQTNSSLIVQAAEIFANSPNN